MGGGEPISPDKNSQNEHDLLTLRCLMMLRNEFKLHARNHENHQAFVMQYTNTDEVAG